MGLWRRRHERDAKAAELSEQQKANVEKKGKGKKKAKPKAEPKAEPAKPKVENGPNGQAKA